MRNLNGQQTDKQRKNIIKIFKSIGFTIEIITNLTEVNFLDGTFNLLNGKYRPCKKPNDNLIYVHTSSNHPPQVLKQLTDSICDILSRNSTNEEIFNSVKNEYEEALNKCGYDTKLKYVQSQSKINSKNAKQRKRKIIWFNPPFNKNVTTNVAKSFLKLIDEHLPSSHRLKKIFNRNIVKVSYSCTVNMSNIIKGHNKRITQPITIVNQRCNCRNKNECPLDGKCRTPNVIYKCVVSAPNTQDKVYIGLTENEWKQRYYNHTKAFRNKQYEHNTALSGVENKKRNQHYTNIKMANR